MFIKIAMIAAIQATATLPPVAFKGLELRRDIESWRSSSPLPQMAPDLVLACLGDAGAPAADWRSAAEQRAGVLQCGYTRFEKYNYWSGGKIGDVEFMGFGVYFLNSKVYALHMRAEFAGLAEVTGLLSEKYGSPTITEVAGSTGIGVQVPVKRYVWRVGADEIRVTAPDSRLDRMSIDFVDRAAEAHVIEADRKAIPVDQRL